MRINSQFALWFGIFAVTIFLLVLLSPILMPFIAAALLAYLADPLVDRLETLKLSRTLSVVVVFISLFITLTLCILVLLPVLETQTQHLISQTPIYIDWAMSSLEDYLQSHLGVDPNVLGSERLKTLVSSNWKETGGFIRNTIQAISKSSSVVLSWIANVALIPVLTFYLLRDWDHLVAYIHDLLPRNIEPVISQLARESDETLGAFLRGQLLVMAGLSILYSLGLSLIGLDLAILIGIISGLVSFVPYLGLIVGVSFAGIAVMFQTQDIINLLWVFAVFGFAQAIEGFILTPLLVGERIGLHPVTVIFSVLAGGQLFGFFGILLALPVAAVLAVLMRHLRNSYKQSGMYYNISKDIAE
ncbi:MAG: AI-2E family transporter [Proteobacteria bacterium]|nr:MAG: AI-2E family transporter [Pseudomonadota bacterium]